jgi:streptogrisin B
MVFAGFLPVPASGVVMVRFRVAALLTALVAALAGIASPAAAAPVTVAGGDVLSGGAYRCTLAYNVTGRGILAGRCGPVGTVWSAGATVVGTTTTVFAGTGLTLLSITNPAVVQLHGIRNGAALIAITAAAASYVGQSVKVRSSTSGIHSGTVTGINQTVNFPEGSISGLVRSTVCVDAGGVGSPVFSGSSALSIVVGGSGNCTSGATTYSQPVPPLLVQTGRAIY